MKIIICANCQGQWTFDNHDEDETIYTICEWCTDEVARVKHLRQHLIHDEGKVDIPNHQRKSPNSERWQKTQEDE